MIWLQSIIIIIMSCLSIWLILTDLYKREIPNLCSFGIVVLSFINYFNLFFNESENIYLDGFSSLYISLGFGIVTVILFAILSFTSIGGGDMKLLIGCAFFATSFYSVELFFIGTIVTSVIALIVSKITKEHSIPGGPIYAIPLVFSYSVISFGWVHGSIITGSIALLTALSLFIFTKVLHYSLFRTNDNFEEGDNE